MSSLTAVEGMFTRGVPGGGYYFQFYGNGTYEMGAWAGQQTQRYDTGRYTIHGNQIMLQGGSSYPTSYISADGRQVTVGQDVFMSVNPQPQLFWGSAPQPQQRGVRLPNATPAKLSSLTGSGAPRVQPQQPAVQQQQQPAQESSNPLEKLASDLTGNTALSGFGLSAGLAVAGWLANRFLNKDENADEEEQIENKPKRRRK